MKKIIVSVLVLSLAIAGKTQEIPDRRMERPMMHQRHKGQHQMPGMVMQKLKLTQEQKDKFKAQHESFRKQMEELKKNENITVKEWKSRMETLRKDNKTKLDGILTADQKVQIEKMKAEHKAMQEIDAKARMEKMKIRLGLTDEQAEKMKKNHLEMAEKMKALREDDKMDADKKKEKIKELMKEQKEKMKSILTEEQLKKIQEHKMQRPPGPPEREII